jgi:hypothetical protein
VLELFAHARDSPRRLLEYDAFVALPLRLPAGAAQGLRDWGARVRAEAPQGAGPSDASIFVVPEKLHLTVVMLKLYSDARRHAAAGALEAAAAKARAAGLLGGGAGPLRVRLQGLANMGADDAAAHVAYCSVGAPMGEGVV